MRKICLKINKYFFGYQENIYFNQNCLNIYKKNICYTLRYSLSQLHNIERVKQIISLIRQCHI